MYATAFAYALGSSDMPKDILKMSGVFLLFCITVAPCSAIVYWYIEKQAVES